MPVVQYNNPYEGNGPPCPKCGCRAADPVKFTWWGGVIGPKLLSHVRCNACRYCFNGKTGRPNTTGILLYSLIGLIIAIVVVYALRA